ncbi:hypothetical protein [Sphaerisporangium sp. NPDC051011]|uniref:hypothetical protein n=1 Tax=Sphaerisporangium sp. NPDC051011 TaxID=3155792 RepID=UPI0033D7170F
MGRDVVNLDVIGRRSGGGRPGGQARVGQRALIQAVLDLESEINKWAADTEEDDGGVEQARALLRGMIARLALLVDLRDPRERLTPLVNPLLTLRGELRVAGAYEFADTVRDALARVGVTVQDTPNGPHWSAS